MKLGILSIAIGEVYGSYWKEMSASLSKHCGEGQEISMYLFTDQEELLPLEGEINRGIRFKVIQVETLGWPAATAMRYAIFSCFQDIFSEEFLMYLDADMKIVDDFPGPLEQYFSANQVTAVAHPGYYRPNLPLQRLTYYLASPLRIIRDLRLRILEGGMGQWEKRQASRAFTKRSLRKNYVCGGVWFGGRDVFLNLCRELAEATQHDRDRGITARWHDESYLNAWFARNGNIVASSEYCYSLGSPNLQHLEPRIIAVEKGLDRIR